MNWFSKNKQKTIRVDQEGISQNPSVPTPMLEEEFFFEEEVAPATPTIHQDVKRRTPIFQPTAFQTLRPIADELIQHQMILIDLSKLSTPDRLRTIDFLTGVMYGLNGEYKKVDHQIYKFIVRK